MTVPLVPFGTTGVKISRLVLGTMNFGAFGATGAHDVDSVVGSALDAGITAIDTADVYSGGESERLIGAAIKHRRDDVFLATKFFNDMGGPQRRGSSRRWIVRAVEESLTRLGTDRIDLYQAHRPDPSTAIEETLETLEDLRREGKILYFGTTTFPADAIVEAQWAASRGRGLRPVSEQPPYSILARGAERDVLPASARYGLGVITWSPLAGGWLSGKFGRTSEPPVENQRAAAGIIGRAGTNPRHDLTLPENHDKWRRVHELQVLADELGITLSQLATAFVLEHPAVTAAIIGPRTLAHLEDAVRAADIVLPDWALDRIDEIAPPGETINAADAGYQPPGIAEVSVRRAPWRHAPVQ